MKYRKLGDSDLEVSDISLGSWLTYGVGVQADAARACLDEAFEQGINFIDTANVYGRGAAESFLGEALGGRARDSYVLATKLYFPMSDTDRGLSRAQVEKQLDASLTRLRTDYVDLYQCHRYDWNTPLEETLEALDDLVRSGKVRYIGASNYSGWHLMKALGVADHRGLPRFVSQQIHYTLQAREAENELVPVSIDQGLGILVWSPIAGGLLSGKFRRGQDDPETSRHLGEWSEPPVHDRERLYDIIEVAAEVADAHGVSVAQVANAWLLRKPGVTSLVIGARTEEQLTDNLAAAELALTDDEVARLDEVSATPLLYPYWHQKNTITDRLSPADASLLAR